MRPIWSGQLVSGPEWKAITKWSLIVIGSILLLGVLYLVGGGVKDGLSQLPEPSLNLTDFLLIMLIVILLGKGNGK